MFRMCIELFPRPSPAPSGTSGFLFPPRGRFWAEFPQPRRTVFFRNKSMRLVAAAVFGAGEPHDVLVTDRYTGYDRPWRGDRQYCFAHILRKFLRLPRKEPDNPEYKAFVPLMARQLKAAMTLRSKGLPAGDFAREAKAIRMYHWARGPDVPAENNRAERGVRGLVIARKTSFGGQSEEALWVRDQPVGHRDAGSAARRPGREACAGPRHLRGDGEEVGRARIPVPQEAGWTVELRGASGAAVAEPLCQPSEFPYPAVQ